MKNKKALSILILVLLVAVASVTGYVTYARYQSKGAGTSAVTVAGWEVAVNGTDITPATNTAFTAGLTWTGLDGLVVANKIAPGMTARAGVAINPAGSEVAMNYWIKLDATALANNNLTVSGVKVGGSCDDGSDIYNCTGDKVWTPGETELTYIPLGTCDGAPGSTEAACSGTWVASTDVHAGEYEGEILLPAGAIMTDAETVNAEVSFIWNDYNTEDANAADTALGTANPHAPQNVVISVTAEQKMN